MELWAVNAAGAGPLTTLTASAPAPAAVTQAEVEASARSLTLKSVTGPAGTGYVLIQGRSPEFGASEVTSFQVIDKLPFTLSGLSPETTYYFRLAVKDAWFDDVPSSYALLNFSGVLSVTTAAD